MNLTKKRWMILAACCFINLCIGSLYAWSVFAAPMAAHLQALSGGEAPNLAVIFTIANGVGPVTMISGGALQGKLGPRRVILLGGLLFGLGMFFSGFATSVSVLLLTYGLGVGLGVGMVYGCTVSHCVKFFPDRRGLIGGIATASYGISSVVVPLLANALISRFSVTAAFRVLGLAMLAVIGLCALAIIPCPAGFVPEGWEPPHTAGGSTAAVKDHTWREMLASPAFYAMLLMLCCGAFSGLMITSQAAQIAQRMVGMTAAEAAAVVSVLALFNTFGRILAGFLSDRLGAVNTILGVFLVSIAGLLLLYCSGPGAVGSFYAGVCIVGLCFGSIMGIYPGFTAARFGSRYNGINYGIMFIGFAAAGCLGPMIMSGIYGSTGAYQPAFLVAAGLAAAGCGLNGVCRMFGWGKE